MKQPFAGIHFSIRWNDNVCCIAPTHELLKKSLTYSYKKMVPDPSRPGSQRSDHIKTPCYVEEQIVSFENRLGLRTYQGFVDHLQRLIIMNGGTYDIVDERVRFPKPNLSKIGGFWHTQRETFIQIVEADRSGVAVLCTRYGKTAIIANLCRAFIGMPIVVVTDGVEPLGQLVDDLKGWLPDRDIVKLGGGSTKKRSGPDITISTYDSLAKCDKVATRLIIADEVHAMMVDTVIPLWCSFQSARKIGLTGSPEGRFDGRDFLLPGLVGPTLVSKRYPDARKDGAVCELRVLAMRIPLPEGYIYRRDHAYDQLFYRNKQVMQAVKILSEQTIPAHVQTLIFIANEKQGEALQADVFGESVPLAMAKRMTAKERKGTVDIMKDASLKRCMASSIFSTGMTFQDLAVVINLQGGGSSTSCVQKPGRLLQVRPGKKCGVLIEFYFDMPVSMRNTGRYTDEEEGKDGRFATMKALGDAMCLHRDAMARFRVYRKNGYTIDFFDDLSSLGRCLNEACL